MCQDEGEGENANMDCRNPYASRIGFDVRHLCVNLNRNSKMGCVCTRTSATVENMILLFALTCSGSSTNHQTNHVESINSFWLCTRPVQLLESSFRSTVFRPCGRLFSLTATDWMAKCSVSSSILAHLVDKV